MQKPEVLLADLAFAEGPRWRDDRLWFSDMHSDRVQTVDLAGNVETIVHVPHQPSGLGWLPDGTLLVVSMLDKKLMRLDDGALSEVADLSPYATWHCNDMVVDAQGRAYVGNFGWNIEESQVPVGASLVLVCPDGATREVAKDLIFPNGTVITPDGKTLIIGETFAARLSAFDIADDGSLSGRREFAALDGSVPDGICLDEEGAIWLACPMSAQVLRVRDGGEVTHRIPVETQAFACMLGGPQRKHLFICTAKNSKSAECRAEHTGRIEVVEVDIPGAGLP
ncbi:MAG: SMP-30/gluconolactonase/LRE family protein [Candidatus Binatia bacterium]|nr:SMP-30/gluconolactonase/LRE family protein [Candidatus Binatia bacterium]